MPFVVRLTHSAARDLGELCDYLDQHASQGTADLVLSRLEAASQETSRCRDPRIPGGLGQAVPRDLTGSR